MAPVPSALQGSPPAMLGSQPEGSEALGQPEHSRLFLLLPHVSVAELLAGGIFASYP